MKGGKSRKDAFLVKGYAIRALLYVVQENFGFRKFRIVTNSTKAQLYVCSMPIAQYSNPVDLIAGTD